MIRCGLSGPCTILCTASISCISTEFYLYSNEAYIECSGLFSCHRSQIFNINATTVTLNFSASKAFQYGQVYVQSSNQHTITHCLDELGILFPIRVTKITKD